MPARETLDRFIALVESGAGLQPIEQFYADTASMQENQHPPRAGKPALLAHEANALARVSTVRATAVGPVLVQGDIVVIRWVFNIAYHDGRCVRFEELAYQRWEGDLIAQEQFFYDPAQFSDHPAGSCGL